MPSVRPSSSAPINGPRDHAPPRMSPSARITLRTSASSNANVYSATAAAFSLPVVVTTMPRRVAAARSTASTPTPWRAMMRSRGACSMTRPVIVPSRARMPSASAHATISSCSDAYCVSTRTSQVDDSRSSASRRMLPSVNTTCRRGIAGAAISAPLAAATRRRACRDRRSPPIWRRTSAPGRCATRARGTLRAPAWLPTT